MTSTAGESGPPIEAADVGRDAAHLRVPTATRYEFAPLAMFEGKPMDSAHLRDPHVITVEWRGGATWAVSLGHGWSSQRVWDFVASEWAWEPLPSSRSLNFLSRCRRPLSEALAVASGLANDADGGAR